MRNIDFVNFFNSFASWFYSELVESVLLRSAWF